VLEAVVLAVDGGIVFRVEGGNSFLYDISGGLVSLVGILGACLESIDWAGRSCGGGTGAASRWRASDRESLSGASPRVLTCSGRGDDEVCCMSLQFEFGI
jgi:hypothetical protein